MPQLDRLLWMGILNITPDSFSDGGQYHSVAAALAHARQLIEEGADILDVGAESTRPFAPPVSAQEELKRLLPVVKAIRKEFDIPLSIDTQKPEVLETLLPFGIQFLNDVSGGTQKAFASLVKAHSLTWIIMHRQGTPETMQLKPSYSEKGVVFDVRNYLQQKVSEWVHFGIPKERIWVDPGIGFGKTLSQNLELLKSLKEFSTVGGRLLIGTSRKSFIASLYEGATEAPDPQHRLGGTIASNLWAFSQGASVFRVHEVFPSKQALLTWKAIDEK